MGSSRSKRFRRGIALALAALSLTAATVVVPEGRGAAAQDCSITIEAETGDLVGAMSRATSGEASGGSYLTSSNSGRIEDFDIADSATYTFVVSQASTYTIEALVRGADPQSDSFWVRIDSGPTWLWDVRITDGFVTADVDDRDDGDVAVDLAAGSHTLVVAMREDGTDLDRITLTPERCGGADTLPPEATVTTPVVGARLSGAVTVTGTATDNVGVDGVEVGFKNRTSGRWLQSNGSLSGTRTFLPASLGSPRAASTPFTTSVSLPEGSWAAQVRSTDLAGNLSTDRVTVYFVVEASGPDTTSPETAIANPANDQVLGRSAVLAGTATDNVGVDGVLVALRDVDSGDWFRADGSFGRFQLVPARLANSNSRSTDWSLPVALPDGNYVVTVRGRDAAGNVESTKPRAFFSVSGAVDTRPNSVIERPEAGEDLEAPDVRISGTATDDEGVAKVRFSVQNTDTGKYLRGDGSFGSFALIASRLDDAGSTSTSWTKSVDLPAGDYLVESRAVDNDGKVERDRPRVAFTVTRRRVIDDSTTNEFVGNAALFHFLPSSVTKYDQEDAREFAERYDLIIAHWRDFKSFIPTFKRVNPDIELLVYQKGATLNGDHGDDHPDSWYLENARGDRVRTDPWNSFLMDISRREVRELVADTCERELGWSGYDGCYFDVLGIGALSIVSTAPVSSDGDEITKEDWHDMAREFSSWLDDRLPNRDPRMANGIGAGRVYFSDSTPSSELSEALGSNHAEVWLRLAHESANRFRSVDDFRKDVDLLVDAGAQGNSILVTTKLWSSSTAAQKDQWRTYAYGAFLLGTDGSHYFAYTADRRKLEGDLPIYSHDIGVADGAYTEVSTGLFTRDFTRGIVAVNATDDDESLTLPSGRFVDQYGASFRGTISLDAHSALVLRKVS